MNWQIGDVAICITPGSGMNGMEVIIVNELHTAISSDPDFSGCIVHTVDPGISPEAPHNSWGAEPKHLIPLPPPNEVTTWEEMEDIFIPQELVTI